MAKTKEFAVKIAIPDEENRGTDLAVLLEHLRYAQNIRLEKESIVLFCPRFITKERSETWANMNRDRIHSFGQYAETIEIRR